MYTAKLLRPMFIRLFIYFSSLLKINITNDVSTTTLCFGFIGVNTRHTAHLPIVPL